MNASEQWWKSRIKIILSTIKFLMLPPESKSLFNSPIMKKVQANYDSIVDECVAMFPFEETMVKCMSVLVENMPQLFVQILRQENMRPILEGALLVQLILNRV